jgi:tetratricopeptide (TPR) repeat protein
MGVVLEARPAAGGSPVALKVVHLDRRDPGGVARAEREARALFAVRHPGVAAVLDVQVTADRLVLATELVRGESVHARVTRAGPLDPPAVVALGRELALALEAVHEEGVVHRDVTPRNVLLADDGAVKLIDFGLARVASPTEERLTTTGELLGTPAYMAPEQADGRAHESDPRTDIYGVGATLYWALTGRPPFSGAAPMQVLQQVLTSPPTSPSTLRPSIPRALEDVVLSCLAKDPAQRPDCAATLHELLGRTSSARRRPSRRIAAAVALLAALAGGVFVTSGAPSARAPLPIATPSGPAPVATGVDPAARGEAEEAEVARLRLVVAACRDLDAPLERPLLEAGASLADLRRAARVLRAEGAERAALRARLAALALGEADPDELERLADQATRCRAPALLPLLERACAAHPGHAGLALARLHALWRSRPQARPVEEVEAGLELLRSGAAGRSLQARVAIARNRLDLALDLLEGTREPEALTDRASLLHKLDRREEARAAFDEAVAADPCAPAVRVVRCLVALEEGAYADPAADLEAALAADPWHTDALSLRALLRFQRGDRDGALQDAHALASVGKRADLPEVWRIRCGLTLVQAVAALEQLDRRRHEMPTDFAAAKQSLLTDRSGARLDGERLRLVAAAAVAAGGASTALEVLDALEANDEARPGDVDLRVLALAGLLWRHEDALRAAEQGARRWPDEAAPLAACALAHLALDRVDEARQATDRALELDPACPRALHVRARLRSIAGDRPGALADLSAAVASSSRDPWSATDLASLLQEAGRHAEADEVLAAAQQAAPGWWRPFYVSALSAHAAGQHGRALRLLATAVIADDRPAEPWSLRARVRVALGDPLGACVDLDAAGGEERASLEWRAAAVDARLGTGDVGGARPRGRRARATGAAREPRAALRGAGAAHVVDRRGAGAPRRARRSSLTRRLRGRSVPRLRSAPLRARAVHCR